MNPECLAKAILLLGPTGAGKTPLGRLCEERGVWNEPCLHFDFGARLRALAAEPSCPAGFTPAEMGVIKDSLATGRLLENEHFPIAAKILRDFARRRGTGGAPWLLLNGLPRHVGQARDLAGLVDIRLVLCLDCPPEVVIRRIRENTGGDRTGRTDDDLPAVTAKLATFEKRTVPLVAFYAERGVPVRRWPMAADTPAEAVHDRLCAGGACPW